MKLNGLDLLFLEVNNLEESLHFYTNVLGFEVNNQDMNSEPPMATLQAGSLKLKLGQHLETMLRRGRGVNLFLGVDDVDEYFQTLKTRGVEVYPPADEGWGGRFITLEDPDKYRYFFVTWSGEAPEVARASRP
ncbi:MAG: VOC family protein [Pyrinomonadaceae bacterium]|nr:VOC family protein [Pyrinomonadaceae bacterium]